MIPITLYRMPGSPLVSVALEIGLGWRHEPPAERGIVHLLEHARALGSETCADPDAATAPSGVTIDGYTERTASGLTFTAMAEDLPRILPIVTNCLFFPTFDPEKLRAESRVVRGALATREDLADWEWGRLRMDDILFETDELRSLGTDESFEGLDRATLLAWHRRFDHPGLCRLIVAGGVEAETVRAATGPLPGSATPAGPPQPVRVPSAERVRMEPGTGSGAELWVGLLLPAPEAGPECSLLHVLVGNHPSSRLWRRLRTEDGLAYCVDARLTVEPDGARLALYTGLSDAADLDRAWTRLIEILEDLAGDGPREEEIDRARRLARIELHRALAAPDGALRWLRRMLRAHPDTPGDANRLVRDHEAGLLAASCESVREAAAVFLRRGRRAVSVVGDVDGWDPTPATIWATGS